LLKSLVIRFNLAFQFLSSKKRLFGKTKNGLSAVVCCCWGKVLSNTHSKSYVF
jgi:hypothetical protein